MEELLTEVLKSFKSQKTPEYIELPTFRPGKDDAKVWLEQVQEIIDEFELSDLQIVVRVGNYLTNDAKIWFNDWSPS